MIDPLAATGTKSNQHRVRWTEGFRGTAARAGYGDGSGHFHPIPVMAVVVVAIVISAVVIAPVVIAAVVVSLVVVVPMVAVFVTSKRRALADHFVNRSAGVSRYSTERHTWRALGIVHGTAAPRAGTICNAELVAQ